MYWLTFIDSSNKYWILKNNKFSKYLTLKKWYATSKIMSLKKTIYNSFIETSSPLSKIWTLLFYNLPVCNTRVTIVGVTKIQCTLYIYIQWRSQKQWSAESRFKRSMDTRVLIRIKHSLLLFDWICDKKN